MDLSNRNPLLNFRARKASLEFAAADLPGIEDRLAAGRKFDLEAGLDLLKKLPREAQEGEAAVDALLRLAAEKAGRNVLVACHGGEDMYSRILKLYRQARAYQEEGGSNVLFLALGFLAWQDGETERQAPLVLVPVSLSRAGAGSLFRLAAAEGDESRFNLTMVEKLRREHGIGDLDGLALELPRDSSGLDIAAIFDLTAAAVARLPGWRVLQRVVLGVFNFTKHIMWKDLSDIEAAGLDRQNPVLNLLINRQKLPAEAQPFLAPEELDDRLRPEEECLPLRADSSQLAAVIRAARGGAFVLIGPPGTGKSQTIANMIAQCIAAGKTVLFVAEKAAALNVVHRRLQAQGLGGFCLELHSNRSDKREMIRRLHEEAAGSPAAPWPEWGLRSDAVAKARAALNSYARSLHRRRAPGLSLYEAVGGLLLRWDATDVELGGKASGAGVLDLGREILEAMRDCVARLGALGRAACGKGSLMRYLARSSWTPSWEEGVAASAGRLLGLWGRLSAFEGDLGPLAAPGLSRTPLSHAGDLLALARLIPKAQGGRLAFALGDAGGGAAPAPGAGAAERAGLAEAARLLEEASAVMGAFSGDAGGGFPRLATLLDGLLPHSGALQARAGLDPAGFSREALAFLTAEALANPGLLRPAWNLAGAGAADGAIAEVPAALDLLRELSAATAGLTAAYDPARALALDHSGLAVLWDSAEGAFFVTAFLRRRRVRAALAAARAPAGAPGAWGPKAGAGAAGAGTAPDVRGDLAQLASARRAADGLAALPALRSLSLLPGGGAVFRGGETDPAALSRFRDDLVWLKTWRPEFERFRASLAAAGERIRET
ncbi:MAG: DUF4011 domain-containing protein, partial [Deltaproteobacteria bacterium]|nr:DUF4011 domain-containing protein [Deltaproteobacteria bacterium]